MPVLRLRKHPASFSEEDILINPNDYPGLRLNDVVELKPPKGGNDSNRILLQVRKWPEISSYPNSVSIKDSVVNAHLKLYSDVLVNIVDKKDVLVDSIEICFGNAYLARSYMWGLRNHLNNRCVYQQQKLDYLHIRSQVCEIWAQGNKVTSGYIDDDAKIVFRSASSLVYLFIQMSSEMWDYDINGDLYSEKAINGFLTDLFDTWRRNDCSHDITIVLFSRTFYDAESIEEFPEEMRECLQLDYKNRFYEDCYRVAFQNDRFDLHNWEVKLTTLKSLFNQYQKEVIDRHQQKYDTKIPRAYNSSASQGNFLEVLNMSLNVFEKHYFDRSFDRTGQLSVVVSPGVGVFEVDFEMTNLTKQRIIDNGIGSDLVCLGEQPLHTVPLLKFNSKASNMEDNLATCDVYNMPHWINLSFYSSENQVYYSSFVPRVKLPTLPSSLVSNECSKSTITDLSIKQSRNNQQQQVASTNQHKNRISNIESSAIATTNGSRTMALEETNKSNTNHNRHSSAQLNNHQAIPDLVDYDDYDSQVFTPNLMVTYHNQQPAPRADRSILCDINPNDDFLDDIGDDFLDRDNRGKTTHIQRRSSDVKNYQEYSRNMKRQISENLPITQSRLQVQNTFNRMSLVDSYLTDVKIKPESADDLSVRGYNVQSSRLNRSIARPKALINPFDPSHMTIKLTPNRRRWTHVFPQGPTGTFIQQHHYQPLPQKSTAPYLADVKPAENVLLNHQKSTNKHLGGSRNVNDKGLNKQFHKSWADNLLDRQSQVRVGAIEANNIMQSFSPAVHNKSTLVSNDTIRFAWCASGEQEWTPAITTGVDWKSLTMPACLPLTTDFFPSKTSLQNDYVICEYNIDSGCIHSRCVLIEVYRELVCQRLQKGFQIILLPRQLNEANNIQDNTTIRPSSSLQRSPSSTNKHHSKSTLQKSSLSSPTQSSQVELERERTEYTMSIGRIFHKLKLNGKTITVTQYKPRHPYPTIKIDYCYRFRAPFHDTYIQSWVHFKSEKLENYSWNYLDNYICARGESFELRSSLEFWRFRILILPSRLCLRKLSHADDDDNESRHDIHYLQFNDEERESLMESFIKLLEIINKTRRASACKAPSTMPDGQQSVSATNSNNSSTTITNTVSSSSLSSQMSIGQQSSPFANGSKQHPAPYRLEVNIGTGSDSSQCSSSADHSQSGNVSTQDTDNGNCFLCFKSINMDIDSALRDAKRAEWVHVQYHCFYDVYQAFELVIKWMVASGAGIAEMVQGWSRKAGANSSVHVVPIPWEPFAMPDSGKADPLRCPLNIKLYLDCLPCTLSCNQVIELQEKILRRFGFQRFYDLISSDNMVHQYVHMSGFAFVALPELSALASADYNNDLSSGPRLMSSQQRQQQPVLVSQAPRTSPSSPRQVVVDKSTRVSKGDKDQPRSGSSSSPSKPALQSLKLVHQDTLSSPHEEYITRHIGGARTNKSSSNARLRNGNVEFIWSWNYMLTKRWRSPSTADESYAVSLMQDFKDFCRNGSNRLVAFYGEIFEHDCASQSATVSE